MSNIHSTNRTPNLETTIRTWLFRCPPLLATAVTPTATIGRKRFLARMATAFEARTVELISVDVFVYDIKVGILGDHGQGQIEAMIISRQFKPLGLFTTARAAIAALVAATMRLPREVHRAARLRY